MTSKFFTAFLIFLAFATSIGAQASVRAVATTPEIAWLVKRVGGDEVTVKSLARTGDNYHFLDARPDYILAVSRAALLCRVGFELEIGWLPKILEKAGNSSVMIGGAGDCDLSRKIEVVEKPAGAVDRTMGDVHASGNPHFWFSPDAMIRALREVSEKLSAIDPARAKNFEANRAQTEAELILLRNKMKVRLQSLAGKTAYQYHKDFSYLFLAYGITNLGSIEEISGVSPSAARLGAVSLDARKKEAAFALASEHDPRAPLLKFSELSGVKVITLPSSLTDPEKKEAYEIWQNQLADALLAK